MTLREKLKAGQPVLGSWVQSGSEVASEILAGVGFDFLALDMEHTESDAQGFYRFARAVGAANAGENGVKTVPLARVRENDTLVIRRVMDGGAEGVIIPLVSNAAEAERAVAAVKYPPRGVRGFAFVRANDWGERFDEYAAQANERSVVIVMIESREAVSNIDAILAVDGVDGVLIGPYDLSGSYGVVGQTAHPLVKEAKRTVLEACLRHGKAAGQHIVLPTAENVAAALAEGYKFLALGMDTVFLAEGAKNTFRMTKGV